jgi:hypothetical protein
MSGIVFLLLTFEIGTTNFFFKNEPLFFLYRVLYMLHIYSEFFYFFCFCSEKIPMVHNIGVITLRIN